MEIKAGNGYVDVNDASRRVKVIGVQHGRVTFQVSYTDRRRRYAPSISGCTAELFRGKFREPDYSRDRHWQSSCCFQSFAVENDAETGNHICWE